MRTSDWSSDVCSSDLSRGTARAPQHPSDRRSEPCRGTVVMSARADVLLYVQHLLGIGHIRRAAVLARAFHRAGLKVVFVTGGFPVRGLALDGGEVVQLPPARRGGETLAIGIASCRERGCEYMYILVVAASFIKKQNKI